MIELNVWVVLLVAAATAVATGLGALPLLFFRGFSDRFLGLCDGFAGGLMLAACFSLVQEGLTIGPGRTFCGALLGLALIVAANGLVRRQGDVDVAQLHGANARKALLILGVMTAHSFAEGVGVGVSFGDSRQLGLFITTAIAIHNIPEGLAISLVLIPRGTSLGRAAGWSIFTSLPQPIMAIPAFLFVLAFKPVLPVGLGLAAGAMVWMVFGEIIPDALQSASKNAIGTAATLAFVLLLAFQHYVLGL